MYLNIFFQTGFSSVVLVWAIGLSFSDTHVHCSSKKKGSVNQNMEVDMTEYVKFSGCDKVVDLPTTPQSELL